jgi:MFS family permease
VKELWQVSLYKRGVLGYCALTFAMGGFAYWAPTFLYKRYALDLAQANFRFGIVTVLAGGVGTAVGGGWADRWVRKRNAAKAEKPEKAYRASAAPEEGADDALATRVSLRVCAIGSAFAAPLAAAAFLAPSPTVFFVLVFFCELFIFLPTSPINAVILRSVPPTMRASAMALSIFAIHLLGDLWSPPLLGLLQDNIPIAPAMMAVPVAIAIAAAAWWTHVEDAPESARSRASA